MHRIADSIEKYIFQHHLMIKGETYLVGLSGGADSVALICLLHRLGYRVHAAHCNFQLRGSESNRDEMFCKNLADKLDIPFHIVRFDTASYATLNKVSIEMAARDLRYSFFEQTRKEIRAKGICVAHHKDDQVETVLLNMSRGTGLNGLLGMKPKNGFVLRPLLDVSRQELIAYLDQIGQDYIVDCSNFVDDVQRNKLRLNIIPELENVNSAFKEHVIRMTEHLGEAQLIIDDAFCKDKQYCTISANLYDWNKIKTLISPSFFLWKLLSEKGFNRCQIAEMTHTHADTTMWYSEEYVVMINQSVLQVVERTEWDSEVSPVQVSALGEYLVGNKRFTFGESEILPDFIVPKDKAHVCVNREKIGFPLIIRRINEGDRFAPFGMKGTKLISDYLKDIKANPLSRRKQLVVTDCRGKIIWLVGCRIDERYKIIKGSTTMSLSIEYTEEES